ncbi:zinc transporter 8 precursor [Striga hermonthica]|uniref:Zinc transporter 8 n=1 Tax=Striga hermonthica TaxID=68872 RepID=A0A9N7NT70_STRHE|nr:zinc transporter 8 precursor [Striga hermonthica]
MSPKLILFLIIAGNFTGQVMSVVQECGGADDGADGCTDKKRALPLKIIAIVSILVTSMIGVCLPLVSRSVPALSPDRSLFVVVKAFAAGIILATGFMHVLPDSFDMLSSNCLKENPWHKFPFTGFVAMLSALVTLMIDSMATSLYSKKHRVVLPEAAAAGDRELEAVEGGGGGNFHHGHGHRIKEAEVNAGSQLLRYRVIAMVSE